jgi:hypothetical protein
MIRMKKDPLLAIAQVILALGIVLFVFLAAMMLIGLGALLTVGRAEIMAELAAEGVPGTAYWGVVAVLALLVGLFVAMWRFLLELLGIVKSVESGDPFAPENARRLSRMGWIAIAGYGIATVIDSIATWIKSVSGEAGKDINVDVGLDGSGVLLILTLFILARVFRQGAAMREELEGTV